MDDIYYILGLIAIVIIIAMTMDYSENLTDEGFVGYGKYGRGYRSGYYGAGRWYGAERYPYYDYSYDYPYYSGGYYGGYTPWYNYLNPYTWW
jgi:hypothetical protein